MTFIVAFIVLILWTLYRINFTENLLFSELFLKPIVWLTPVLLAVKFNFNSLGLNKKNIYINIAFGLVVGFVLSAERVFIKQVPFRFDFFVLVTSFFTATVEEIFFRGYLLNHWLKYFSKPLVAMFFNGLFFTLTHVPIAIFVYHYYYSDLFSYLVINFTSGFVDIFLFYKTKSIYTSISNHFVWNAFSGMFR